MGTGAYAKVGSSYVHWVTKGNLTEAELVEKVRSELHNKDRMYSEQACKKHKQQQPQQPQARAQAPPRQQQFRKRDREGAVASVEQQVEACFSYLERHAGMAHEVERASRGVLTAYGSLSLEQAVQCMHASLGEPASATIRCVPKWSDDMARRQALGRARAQERAVRTAMQEVQRVQREMTHKMGEMRGVAISNAAERERCSARARCECGGCGGSSCAHTSSMEPASIW